MSVNKSTRKRLFIIDGYALLYRAHFAMIRNPLINSKGMHTSALFGFVNQVLKLLRQEKPDYLMAAFDSSKKTFRHERYPEYKATREKMPEEMRDQLPYLGKLMDAMRIPTLERPGFEADDIIGTLAKKGDEFGLDVYIVSGDKDFMQLINDHVFLYSPSGSRKDLKIYDREGVIEKWGVPPEKIIDLLGLMGDASDNVPGVMGVGEKTAVKLLNEYGTLENALDHADEVKNKRAREGLQNCRENAFLSQELVTIVTNMDIEENFEEMETNGFNVNALDELFRELEFQALQTQLNAFHGEAPTEGKRPEKDYKTLLTQDEIRSFVNRVKKGKWLSFDLETTSVIPMRCEIVGLSFSTKANTGVYIPIQYKEKEPDLFGDALNSVLSIIKPMMEDASVPKTGQNIKFDALILKRHGIDVKGIQFDTLIAAHLLQPESRNLKLDNLSMEHLEYRMVPITDLIGKGRNQITMAEVELEKCAFYAAEDADVALQLTYIFENELKKVGIEKFFKEIEMPLLPVLLEMEFQGMFVDGQMLETMSVDLGKKIDSFVIDIQKEAGTEFNVNSTQQLANILFDIKGLPEIKKRSTAENVLQRLKNDNPIPGLILEYRKLNKLKNTYIDALPALIHPETKRIHSTFSQTVASTGRLSSRDPNFQNIPIRTEEGREIRKAFRCENNDWKIFSADYSQIELRIMAHISQDEALVDAFNKGEDIHTRTAAEVFNVAMEDVIPEMRRTAKIVNFGLLYGAGPFRMSQELGIPLKEAKAIIEAYFNRYSGIKNYIDSTVEKARENHYVETMLGRRRPVWDIDSSNHLHREAAKRMAINMPIQGTNAEMIKLAMVAIQKNIETGKLKSKMVLQVHDELVFEVPDNELDSLESMVVKEMEIALPLSVPIVVDCGHGKSWYEAH
ncbi:MAG: DNA polymerase I [Candidatus Marinimicrobia bacterium]|jgi:DNA polymerase-1|nr:DNA polymerase I [Candidatus Neomarinimicrobiota bacterium]MBT3675104.1 DNA polymerase I [Candidatus Neomarinimicrobiota bacterium]MBT3763544.1 DNA polymerase I [Candidatus Neomarinimicrobiota bacterium]MBT4067567.1 DNA polymerase I [Candidatus Neomarinimicrobiota bacterium]MBT4270368.1 DNA polymerase I [Candidatus Neomarinimicrobiota bacterium]